MSQSACPICNSDQTQSFWHWEKEDTLVRAWALDTRVHFSICRTCSTVFQDPMVDALQGGDTFSFSDPESTNAGGGHEPIDWLQQFTGEAKEPGRVLEIHLGTPTFQGFLESQGWSITSCSLSDLETGAEVAVPEGGFDLVIGFYILNRAASPGSVLDTIHPWINPEGGILVEELNPLTLPRMDQITLKADNRFIFPYPTLTYLLQTHGFTQKMGEISGSGRGYFVRSEPATSLAPSTFATPDLWHYTVYRFQRNYYFSWVARFLRTYLQQQASQPDSLDKARAELHGNPFHLQLIRDACGATFLFVQEVSTLNDTITNDWPQTMSRIFNVLRNDFALYEILNTAGIQNMGTLPSIDRFHFNEKMVYTTEREYFEKYFEQQDAQALTQSILSAGKVVVSHMSSFL